MDGRSVVNTGRCWWFSVICLLMVSAAPAAIIKGTVSDTTSGMVLANATVQLQGTATQTKTTAQGKFSLNFSSGVRENPRTMAATGPQMVYNPEQRTIIWNTQLSGRVGFYRVTGEAVSINQINGRERSWNVGALADGMYLVQVNINQETYNGKLLLAGHSGNLSFNSASSAIAGTAAKTTAAVMETLVFTMNGFRTKTVAAADGDTALQIKLQDSYPNAGNTGTHGTLTMYAGSMSFYHDTLVENVEIHTGGIYLAAPNITFRNCRVIYNGTVDASATVFNCNGGGKDTTIFQDCEIDGQNAVARAIEGSGVLTVLRCNIHNTGNGVEYADHFNIEDSYLHDIFTPSGLSWHADGIQAGGGALSNMTVKHNTIFNTGDETSCIGINGGNDTSGSVTNCLVENNLCGGAGYTMYTGCYGPLTNYQVINNQFTTRIHPKVGYYNLWYPSYTNMPVKSGNTMLETGVEVENNL